MAGPDLNNTSCNPLVASCAVPATDGSLATHGRPAPADAITVAQWATDFSVDELKTRAQHYLASAAVPPDAPLFAESPSCSSAGDVVICDESSSKLPGPGVMIPVAAGAAVLAHPRSIRVIKQVPWRTVGAHAALGTVIYAGMDQVVVNSNIPEEWRGAATAGGTLAVFGGLDAATYSAAQSTTVSNFMQSRMGVQPQRLFPGGVFSRGLIRATPLFMVAGVGNAVVLDQFGVPLESRANGIASVGMTFAEAGIARYAGMKVPALAGAYNAAGTGAVLRVANWGLAAWAGDAIGTAGEGFMSDALGYSDDPHYRVIKYTWDAKNHEKCGGFLNGWVGGAIKGVQSITGTTPEWNEMTATWDQWTEGLNEFGRGAEALLIDAALLAARVDPKTKKFSVASSRLSSQVRDAYTRKRIGIGNSYATLELLAPSHGKGTYWADDVKQPAEIRDLIAVDGSIKDAKAMRSYLHGKLAAMERKGTLRPHLKHLVGDAVYHYNLEREKIGLPPIGIVNGKINRATLHDAELLPEQAQFLYGNGKYSPAMVFEARLENLQRLHKLALTQSPENPTPVADLLFGNRS